RNRPELVEPIMESYRWLGLLWDEGPYFQSHRFELYRQHAQKLLEQGHAYKCYCTPEELEARRKEAMAAKRNPRYDRRCRDLTPEQEQAFIKEGRKPALRIKAPSTGVTVVDDLIRGRVEFDSTDLDDFIMQRGDGRPTYNFAVVVDDVSMKITHVIRADEHLNNTPKQILIYRALNYPLPVFAHVPMVLAKDRSKLSKRHGSTAVSEFQDRGILPEALVNYLARLGWSHGDQEIFTIDELIQHFALEQVHPSAAIFDEEKLLWLNHHYIKSGDPKKISEQVRAFLVKRGHMSESDAQAVPSETLAKIVDFFKERNRTLVELADSASYLLKDSISYDPEGVKKFLTPDKFPLLEGLAIAFSDVPEFKTATLDHVARGYLETKGKTLKDVAQSCRVAITGRTTGAGLFETMEILGRDKVITRLRQANTLISQASREN
ncbi:glutamate--tRNA ligase, partial [Candidatus Acetothermia bacterium]|nr:glutamate--tRNA ligase [Candidatus Acetothermia bacterium]